MTEFHARPASDEAPPKPRVLLDVAFHPDFQRALEAEFRVSWMDDADDVARHAAEIVAGISHQHHRWSGEVFDKLPHLRMLRYIEPRRRAARGDGDVRTRRRRAHESHRTRPLPDDPRNHRRATTARATSTSTWPRRRGAASPSRTRRASSRARPPTRGACDAGGGRRGVLRASRARW